MAGSARSGPLLDKAIEGYAGVSPEEGFSHTSQGNGSVGALGAAVEDVSGKNFRCHSESRNLCQAICVWSVVGNDFMDVVLGNCGHYFFLK